MTAGHRPLYEDWGEYELPNGLRCFVRNVLTLVVDKRSDGRGQIRFQTQSEVLAPKEMQGEPTKLPILTPPAITAVFEKPRAVRESRCAYELENGTVLRVVSKLEKVSVLDAFGPNREPILTFEMQQQISMEEPAGAESPPARST